jgi:hypothetical protein
LPYHVVLNATEDTMKRFLFAAAALLACAPAFAADQHGTIDYKPQSCILGDEMPLFRVETHDEGILRSYFRRVNTTDWCYVDGENRNSYSSITLPKVLPGDEIEYYFIVLKGDEVVAKSPRIYRARATEHCDATYNRHALVLTLECLPPSQNPMASSLAAAYAAQVSTPRPDSPEKP